MKKDQITPLSIFFVIQLLTGIYILIRPDGDPEGWHYIVGFMCCLFAVVPLLIDFILKYFIKEKPYYLFIQIVLTITLLFLYFIWDLTFFSTM
ncbi:MAG: hypothetical protein AB8B65_02965 [Kordia sp.]|uniref:hypothetical protein n=1 Tax=Kordia sp. TaxID=1965332 RepID=UPI00385A749E